MKHELVNGWYEIYHNVPDINLQWRPCEEWCEEIFGYERDVWYKRNVVYEFHKHPTTTSLNTMSTVTPLTWMFKEEKDAMLFLLRWNK